jgi:8-oxo-dGTP pyrophosphatase MutT (NUDIX family)
MSSVIERARVALGMRSPHRLELVDSRRAAVAVLLVVRHGAAHVVLTTRAESMREHSGQVSLPGGACDPEDAGPIATAQREAAEELGIEPATWNVLGELDDVFSRSGWVVTPVVGALPAPVYRPNPHEVAGVFEAPLALFADPSRAEHVGVREYQGHSYSIRAYTFGGHRIWGLTARILEGMWEQVLV